jgi:hypothetical protein
MKQDMAGIITYQGAVMDQDVNLTEPTFLDGPMVDNDFFESLMCIDERMLLPTALTACRLFT